MSIKAVTAANSKVQTTANSPIASRQLAPQISTKNPVSNSTGQNFQSIKHKIHVSQSSRDDNQRTTNTKSDCQLTPRQNIAVGNGQNEKLAPLPIQLITSYKTIPHQQNGQCHSTGPDPNRPRLNGQQQVPIQNGDNHKGSKPMNHTRLVQHASNLTPPSSFYSPFQFDLPNKMSHKPNPLHE